MACMTLFARSMAMATTQFTRNLLRICRCAAVRRQHGKQNSTHELGRGHRQQRCQTTQDAMDIVRAKLLTARAREQL